MIKLLLKRSILKMNKLRISFATTLIFFAFSVTCFAQNTPWPKTGSVGIGTTDIPSDFWNNRSHLVMLSNGYLGDQGSNGITLSWNTYRVGLNGGKSKYPVIREINDRWPSSFIMQGSGGVIIATSHAKSDLIPPTRLIIKPDGNVGIGTTNPQSELAVNGRISAKEIACQPKGWADKVFKDSYNLKSLKELESYINEYQHLPDIPSESEVLKNGINLGEMQAKLLQKIEELTLYMIELEKKNSLLENEIISIKESFND